MTDNTKRDNALQQITIALNNLNQTWGSGTIPASVINTLERTLDSIAALRAYTPNPPTTTGIQVYIRGYSSPNGFGAGPFYWNPSSTATDDGGSVILPTGYVGSGRWIRIFVDGVICIDNWGADPTGVASSVTAFKNAVAYISATGTGADLIFSYGTYLLDSTVYLPPNQSISLVGQGRGQSVGEAATVLAIRAPLVTITFTGTTHTSTTVDSISSTAGLVAGQAFTCSGAAPGTIIASVGVSSITLDRATTSSVGGTSCTASSNAGIVFNGSSGCGTRDMQIDGGSAMPAGSFLVSMQSGYSTMSFTRTTFSYAANHMNFLKGTTVRFWDCQWINATDKQCLLFNGVSDNSQATGFTFFFCTISSGTSTADNVVFSGAGGSTQFYNCYIAQGARHGIWLTQGYLGSNNPNNVDVVGNDVGEAVVGTPIQLDVGSYFRMTGVKMSTSGHTSCIFQGPGFGSTLQLNGCWLEGGRVDGIRLSVGNAIINGGWYRNNGSQNNIHNLLNITGIADNGAGLMRVAYTAGTGSFTPSFRDRLFIASVTGNLAANNAAITATCTTAGTTAMTSVSSVTGLFLGALIAGPGIQAGTTIAAIPTSSTITLSNAALTTVSGGTFTFSNPPYVTNGWQVNPIDPTHVDLLGSVNSVTGTGNTHSNTTVDTLSNATGITCGMTATISGVTGGTTVIAIPSATSVTLSAGASTSLTGTSVVFTQPVWVSGGTMQPQGDGIRMLPGCENVLVAGISTNGALSGDSQCYGVCNDGDFTATYGTLTVTGAADNGSGAVRLTFTGTSSYLTGDLVSVQGVHGTTEANGTWGYVIVDSTHCDLAYSVFTNAWTSGGTVTPAAQTNINVTGDLSGNTIGPWYSARYATDVRFRMNQGAINSDISFAGSIAGSVSDATYNFTNVNFVAGQQVLVFLLSATLASGTSCQLKFFVNGKAVTGAVTVTPGSPVYHTFATPGLIDGTTAVDTHTPPPLVQYQVSSSTGSPAGLTLQYEGLVYN